MITTITQRQRVDALPPSVLAARRDAERMARIEHLPRWWKPEEQSTGGYGEVPLDAWMTLSVIGALWAGEIAGVPMAWDGDTLRGDGAALLEAVRRWRVERAGKGGVVLGTRDHGSVVLGLRRQRADSWAGQIDALRIWQSCAATLNPDAGIEQTATHYEEHDGGRWPKRIPLSATGYDWRAIGDGERDGFSVARHSAVVMHRWPAVELLSLLGAEWCIRHGRWQRRSLRDEWDDWHSHLYIPRITGTPLRDANDVDDAMGWMRHQWKRSGQRRYLLPGGIPAAHVPPQREPDEVRAARLKMLVERSGWPIAEAARLLGVSTSDLKRNMSSSRGAPTEWFISRAAMLPSAPPAEEAEAS